MSEQKKRVVVDGVDFGDLFFFPRILGSVTSSLQPPRLAIALLMVMALVFGGKLWDQVVGTTIPPGGLRGDDLTNTQARTDLNELLQEAIIRYRPAWAPQSEGGTQEENIWLPETKDPDVVLREIERGYVASRSPELPNIDELDATYDSYVERIRALVQTEYRAMVSYIIESFHDVVRGVVYLDAREVIAGLGDLVINLPRRMWQHAQLFTVVYGLFALLVFAVGGGALSRMAAVQVAGQERMRIRNAVDFAAGNWVKLVLAPTLPLIILFVLGLVIAAFGVLMNVPILNIVGGLSYALFLLLGLLISFLLLCYAVGFPMLIPAVACENCDAGDSMTRTFNYVLVRPLHYVGYLITAIVGMAIGFIIVAFIAVLTLKATGTLFGMFTSSLASTQVATDVGIFDLDQGPVQGGQWHENWAAQCIAFWQMIVISLVAAYVLTYFFSASTTVYLLMRRVCDGQDVEEIWWPGLMPGTLAPMPRTRVDFETPSSADTSADTAEPEADQDDAGGDSPDSKSSETKKSTKSSTKKKSKKKATAKKKKTKAKRTAKKKKKT